MLPLVVRAGGGSARDTLSILDQLLAGSDEDGIRYDRAVALLGYTDASLLDEIVDAFAAADGAAVFRAVNRVIEGGHEPRRFATDMLDRFRDLIVLASVPDAISSGLLDVPPDRADALAGQAERYGLASLTRAADIVATGLDQMRGATSPRLLLELMCAQVLLPARRDRRALAARPARTARGRRGRVRRRPRAGRSRPIRNGFGLLPQPAPSPEGGAAQASVPAGPPAGPQAGRPAAAGSRSSRARRPAAGPASRPERAARAARRRPHPPPAAEPSRGRARSQSGRSAPAPVPPSRHRPRRAAAPAPAFTHAPGRLARPAAPPRRAAR